MPSLVEDEGEEGKEASDAVLAPDESGDMRIAWRYKNKPVVQVGQLAWQEASCSGKGI